MRHVKTGNLAGLAVAFAAALLTISRTAPAGTVATWDAGGNGLWGDAANWIPVGVPDGDFDVIITDSIPGVGVTIAPNLGVDVASLLIGSDDALTMEWAAFLTVDGGPIENAGVLSVGATPSPFFGHLFIKGEVALSGGGTVVMADIAYSRIGSATGADHLINEDNTIRGSGSIGLGGVAITNHGSIIADQVNAMVVQPSAAGIVNTGLLEASDGARLELYGALDNTGGLIRVQDGSTVFAFTTADAGGDVDVVGTGELHLFNATFTGGTIDNGPGGEIRALQGGSNTLGGVVTNPAGGTIVVENGTGITLPTGTSVVNDGEISLNAAGFTSLLILTGGGDVTLGGAGEVILSDHPSNGIHGATGTERLVNDGNTIRGAGSIGVGSMSLVNRGAIVADRVTPLHSYFNAGGLDNEGTITAEAGSGGYWIQDGPVTTSGAVNALGGATISVGSSFVQAAGTTTVEGELEVAGGVVIDGDVLRGPGLVDGNVQNENGRVAPGSSAGTMTVDGTYDQAPTACLEIEIGGPTPGSEHDRLDVTQTATLAGACAIVLTDGFMPSLGDEFVIVAAPEIAGAFDCLVLPDLDADFLVATHGETHVTLSVESEPANAADVDRDGVVGIDDVIRVILDWGPCQNVCPCCPADVDGTGLVDIDDLVAVILGWG